MSEKTQLTRITVPAITDARYIEGLSDAFDKINDNFKKIASLPFLQGVQGDSYQLEEYKIWNDDWSITEDGKVLLDSIFGKDVTVKGNYFNDIRGYIGEELDGVSPLDFFKNGNDIVNNSLYFYVIKDDTGNVIEKQLGQYYYFVDGRLKNIGNIYNGDILDVSLDGFNDYTGFYQYKYNPKSYNQTYLKVEILPSIYYDQDKNDICWKFNGNETGISAIGVKGADGKDADLLIVRVTANENDCTGVVNAIINPIGANTSAEEDQWIDETEYFKVGKALICIQRDNTAQDFAYGQVIQSGSVFNAYWEPNYNFSKLIGNNRITNYFYNMGDDDTETSPFYLAIPSSYNRGASGTDKKKAHVIKGSSETSETSDDLNIFYSEDAFGENGEQTDAVTISSSTKKLNIKNYDTTIDKKLTVGSSVEVSGGLTVNDGGLSIKAGDLSVTDNATIDKKLTVGSSVEVSGGLTVIDSGLTVNGGGLTVNSGKFVGNSGAEVYNGLTVKTGGAVVTSGGIQVTTEKPSAAPNKSKNADVKSNVLIGHNNPGLGAYNYFPIEIKDGGYPLVTMSYTADGSELKESKNCIVFGNADICALEWNGTEYKGGTLCLQDVFGYYGKTKVGYGPFEVLGTSLLNGAVTMNSKLDVGGALTVSGQSTLRGIVNITNTTPSSDKDSGALVVTGGVGISGAANIGGGATIRNGATVFGIETQPGGTGLSVYGGTGATGSNGGTGAIIDGGNSRTKDGGIGLIVRGGTCLGSLGSTGSTGLGLKVERGGAEIYSGTGTNTDNNILSVKNNAVYVYGDKGLLSAHKIVSDTAGIYERSNGGTKEGITYTLNDLITNDEGNVYCGGINDPEAGKNVYRAIHNRSSVQSYEHKNNSGTQQYTGVTFYINPCGGTVTINQRVSRGELFKSSTSTTTGALVVNGGVGINENLHVGERLVVNKDGTNNISNPSEIYGRHANNGGTSDGGMGLVVYGGSGRETNDEYHGKGGIGLVVYGGSAGKFTGSTSSLAGYGGTGLVVYGGQAGEGPAGVTNTGHTGAAIKTYGNIEIGDRDGSYTSTLSSNSSGFKIDKHISIPGIGNTKYQTTEVTGTTANNSITLDSGSRVYIYDKVHTGDSNLTITLNKATDNIDFPIYLLFKTGIKTGVVGSGNKTIDIVVGSKTFNTGNIYNNEGYTSGLLFVIFDKFCFVQCNYSPVNGGNYTNGGQRVLY